MNKRSDRIFPVVLLCLLAFTIPREAMSATKVLAVPKIVQEQNQWCWAGTSSAVLRYFAKDIKQCYIADSGWGVQTCCDNPAGCNNPNSMYGAAGSIQDIFSHWCLSSSGVASALTFPAVQAQINVNRPFIIRYGWTSGGGHFIVLRGYQYDATKKWVYLMNPWPGKGYGVFTYNSVKQAADHTWTHTLKDVHRTATQGQWQITNTTPTVSSGCGGNPYKCWRFSLSLTETAGGCGKITSFFLDFYDQNNKFTGRQSNTAADFASWFADCADPDWNLPRLTKFCANQLWVHLGGKPSGWVTFTFLIRKDTGTTVKVAKKIRLPGPLTAPGGGPEEAGPYVLPKAGF